MEVLGIINSNEQIESSPRQTVETRCHTLWSTSFRRHKFKRIRWRVPLLPERDVPPGLKKLKVGYPAEKNEQWSDEHDSAFAT